MAGCRDQGRVSGAGGLSRQICSLGAIRKRRTTQVLPGLLARPALPALQAALLLQAVARQRNLVRPARPGFPVQRRPAAAPASLKGQLLLEAALVALAAVAVHLAATQTTRAVLPRVRPQAVHVARLRRIQAADDSRVVQPLTFVAIR